MRLAVRSKAQHLLLSPRVPDLGSERRPFLSPDVLPSCSGLGSLSPSSVLRRGVGSGGESSAEAQQGGTRLIPAPNEPVWPPSPSPRNPKPAGPDALSLRFVRAVWWSSLTLTVSSGREVAAASFPRATESGYCPRRNSAEMEAHTARARGEDQGPAPRLCQPRTALLPDAGPSTASSSQPWPAGLRAVASVAHRPPQLWHLSPAPQLGLGRRSSDSDGLSLGGDPGAPRSH